MTHYGFLFYQLTGDLPNEHSAVCRALFYGVKSKTYNQNDKQDGKQAQYPHGY
jgi:hypothetical protein